MRATAALRTVHDPPHARRDRAVDQVEPDLLVLAHHEGCPEEHDPYPQHDRQLVAPAGGPVKHVAEDDLKQEGDEHDADHDDDEIFAAPIEPLGKRT
jgi:hypothetical protein